MPSLPELYAILDIDAVTARGLEPRAVFQLWLEAGIRLIQLRAKSMPAGAMLRLAEALATDARSAGATFIVNDRADLAWLAGADGVHVGQCDLTPTQLSALIAPNRLRMIGLSTHTLGQLRQGLSEPTDYLAIGPVFPTRSKINADPVVGVAMVRDAAEIAGAQPLVAIGGMTLETAPAVLAVGAASVAVISDLLVGDVRDRARAYVDAICR